MQAFRDLSSWFTWECAWNPSWKVVRITWEYDLFQSNLVTFSTRWMAICHFWVVGMMGWFHSRLCSFTRFLASSIPINILYILWPHTGNQMCNQTYDHENCQMKTHILSRYYRRLTEDIKKRRTLILIILCEINPPDSGRLFVLIEITKVRQMQHKC